MADSLSEEKSSTPSTSTPTIQSSPSKPTPDNRPKPVLSFAVRANSSLPKPKYGEMVFKPREVDLLQWRKPPGSRVMKKSVMPTSSFLHPSEEPTTENTQQTPIAKRAVKSPVKPGVPGKPAQSSPSFNNLEKALRTKAAKRALAKERGERLQRVLAESKIRKQKDIENNGGLVAQKRPILTNDGSSSSKRKKVESSSRTIPWQSNNKKIVRWNASCQTDLSLLPGSGTTVHVASNGAIKSPLSVNSPKVNVNGLNNTPRPNNLANPRTPGYIGSKQLLPLRNLPPNATTAVSSAVKFAEKVPDFISPEQTLGLNKYLKEVDLKAGDCELKIGRVRNSIKHITVFVPEKFDVKKVKEKEKKGKDGAEATTSTEAGAATANSEDPATATGENGGYSQQPPTSASSEPVASTSAVVTKPPTAPENKPMVPSTSTAVDQPSTSTDQPSTSKDEADKKWPKCMTRPAHRFIKLPYTRYNKMRTDDKSKAQEKLRQTILSIYPKFTNEDLVDLFGEAFPHLFNFDGEA